MGDDRAKMKIPVIPTGNIIIDRALGVGGFPRGRIVEIYGPESSGKTTLTLTLAAQAQKLGGTCAFIDVEHALDPRYARKLGVNMQELLVSQPDSGEEALTICETLVRSNAIDVIVVDSVAALVTKNELEGQMGDAVVGSQARLMSAGDAETDRHDRPGENDLCLHQPDPGKNRGHVRQPGNHPGR
jgi:recombination protein RecA